MRKKFFGKFFHRHSILRKMCDSSYENNFFQNRNRLLKNLNFSVINLRIKLIIKRKFFAQFLQWNLMYLVILSVKNDFFQKWKFLMVRKFDFKTFFKISILKKIYSKEIMKNDFSGSVEFFLMKEVTIFSEIKLLYLKNSHNLLE